MVRTVWQQKDDGSKPSMPSLYFFRGINTFSNDKKTYISKGEEKMNIFKKMKNKFNLKKIQKQNEELNNRIDIGLAYIMLKCKVLIDEGSAPDDELKNMVKSVGQIIIEKEEIDEELKRNGINL